MTCIYEYFFCKMSFNLFYHFKKFSITVNIGNYISFSVHPRMPVGTVFTFFLSSLLCGHHTPLRCYILDVLYIKEEWDHWCAHPFRSLEPQTMGDLDKMPEKDQSTQLPGSWFTCSLAYDIFLLVSALSLPAKNIPTSLSQGDPL